MADKQKKMFAEAKKTRKVAGKINVNIHFMGGRSGTYIIYALAEAGTSEALNMFSSGTRFKIIKSNL